MYHESFFRVNEVVWPAAIPSGGFRIARMVNFWSIVHGLYSIGEQKEFFSRSFHFLTRAKILARIAWGKISAVFQISS
jgi:hypothetical protein